jgi:hypothetical protein
MRGADRPGGHQQKPGGDDLPETESFNDPRAERRQRRAQGGRYYPTRTRRWRLLRDWWVASPMGVDQRTSQDGSP